MTKYFVKLIATATPDNPTFAGHIHEYLYGKEETLIEAKTGDATFDRPFSNYFAREYGYKRPCDARRSWSYKNTDDRYGWTYKAEIIELDV